jgi:hypothetical protein
MPIIDPIYLTDDKPIICASRAVTDIGSGARLPEIIMSIRSTILAATFTLASLGAAHADGVRPFQARNIDLGEVAGIAYYTVERDGFRVVSTVAQGGAGTPIRVVAVLAPGQSVVLSTPREAGVAPVAVEITRQADTVLVRKAAAATN